MMHLHGLLAVLAGQSAAFDVWQLDPLETVFREATPVTATIDPYDVAKGEVAEWQIAIRCDRPLRKLTVKLTPMRLLGSTASKVGRMENDPEGIIEVSQGLSEATPLDGDHSGIWTPQGSHTDFSPPRERGLGAPKARFVGLVPCTKPPTWPSSTQLKKPPADYPDPLLEEAEIDLPANQSQAAWIDLAVPKSAKPGLYESTVEVKALIDGKETKKSLPIRMRVYDVFVGKNRLKSTNWYFAWDKFWTVKPRRGETAEDAKVRVLGESLAAHRQNVAMVSALDLADYSLDKEGKLRIGFKRFDHRVEILMKAGVIGTIEGGGIGTREGWAKPNLGIIWAVENGKPVQKVLPAADPKVEQFYSVFFPAMLKHLKEKQWVDRYVQHIVDEPCDDNVDTYRILSNLAVKYLPGVRRLDTCCGLKFEGLMDVYSPELDFLKENPDHFFAFQRAGKELWFYTCWKPQGEYANRLIEEPLIKTRLLHWIHFRYGITGYLDWGYNYWVFNSANGGKDDPFRHEYSPAGDAWIVYPGKDGLLDSRRNESMRDGIADHELLSMLADRDPASARALAGKIVLAMDRYELDVKTFRAVRREVLENLANLLRRQAKG